MRIWGHHSPEDYRSAPATQQQSSSQASQGSNQTGRFAAASSQATTTQLSLTTADGDKVVLSLSNASVQGAASGGGDYASLRGKQTQVNIQVEGDLSKDELEDIQKLARIVSRAASDVLRGNVDRADRRLQKANSLDSIQSFAFSLNRQVAHVFSYQEGAAPA